MKHKVKILFTMLVMISMVFPVSPALALDEPYLSAGLNPARWLELSIPIPDDNEDTIIWEAAMDGTTVGNFAARYNCESIEDCEVPGYYASATVTFQATGHWANASPYITINLPNTSPLMEERVDCDPTAGGGDWWEFECEATMDNFHVEAEDLYYTNPESPWHYPVTISLEGLIWSTVTMDVKVTVSLNPIEDETNCEDQYMINGDAINTGTIPATASSGVIGWSKDATGRPSVGDWVAIKFTNYWLNNGAGNELQTAAMRYGTGGIWFDLTTEEGGSDSVWCVDEGRNAAGVMETWVYLQVTNPAGNVYLRVADHDGNWLSNTGSLNFTVYSVIYSPVATGCGVDYEIGEYLGTRSAAANSTSGINFNFTAVGDVPRDATGNYSDRIVVAETVAGWMNSSTYSTDGGMRKMDANPDPFEAMETYSLAECIEVIDPLGHVRVYWTIDPDDITYSFRAEDAGSYTDNTGQLSFKFYQATYLPVDDQEPGQGDNCAGLYSLGPKIDEFSISANVSGGYYIDEIMPGAYYAIRTFGGPWEDNSVESYDVAMGRATSTPTSWENIITFGLCTDYDGYYTTTYIYAPIGYKNWIRVDDEDSNFGNNTGTIGISVYQATNDGNNWENCGDAYTITEVATDPALTVVPGNQIGGTQIMYLKTGADMAVEIMGTSAWTDPDVAASYAADVCLVDADGCDWVPIQDAVDASISYCVVQTDADKDLYRMYFTVEGVYKLRVHDTDMAWMENSGSLDYKVYNAHYIEDGEDDGDDDGDKEEELAPWAEACQVACVRPDSLWQRQSISIPDLVVIEFNVPAVGAWVDWAVCNMVKYFTWCPYHTATVMGIGITLGDEVEPMATFNLLVDFMEETRGQIEALELDAVASSPFDDIGGQGGSPIGEIVVGEAPNVPANPVDMLMPGLDRDNSPWFGGDIDLSPDSEVDPYKATTIAECEYRINPYVGTGAGGAVCDLHYMIGNTSLFIALITALDIALLVFVGFRYIPAYVKRWFRLFESSGGTRSLLGGGVR